MNRKHTLTLSTFLTLALTACGGGGGGGGASSSASTLITEEWQAEWAVEKMAEIAIAHVLSSLPTGSGNTVTHSAEVVAGDAGTATVDGTIASSRRSTSNSVSSSYLADVIIRFDDFKIAWTNGGKDTISVNGTVAYRRAESSYQSGTSTYSSNRSVRTAGKDVQVHLHWDDVNTPDIMDTMSFEASGLSNSRLKGVVATESGTINF